MRFTGPDPDRHGPASVLALPANAGRPGPGARYQHSRLFGFANRNIVAGKNEGTFGFSADAYEFEMEFELDGDEWLLTSARWAELGEELR